MKDLTLPKSVKDSQRFIAWVFLLLMCYGVVGLPTATWPGRIALMIVLLVVVTGWQSFAVIEEPVYNDVLLVTDLALLAGYWLLMYYSQRLTTLPSSADGAVFNISGMVFFLYAIWDAAALLGRDTSALATAAHLQRFVWIVLVTGAIFFALGALAAGSMMTDHGRVILRILAASVWLLILLWWQVGKWRAMRTG